MGNEDLYSGLELVQLLLRRVVRGFYSAKHSIVLDIVLKHSAIRDDYLAQMMGLQNQEVRKLCGRLREDRLLTAHTRQEPKEGQSRLINRNYYYIDHRDAVDAVKYRIHRLVRTIEDQSKNDFDSKGYVCPYCNRRYGALDVLPLVSMDGQNFECTDCSSVLADDEESMESKVSQQRLANLQKQTHRLVSTLKRIDTSFVPDNDFATALANAVPPPLDFYKSGSSLLHDTMSADNRHIAQTTTSALGVKVDYDTTLQDTPEEKARKMTQAKMNALPEWHLQSTVQSDVNQTQRANLYKTSTAGSAKEVKLDAVASDEVAEYYKALKAQELAESQESEDDDEEDNFEDITTEPRSTVDELSVHTGQAVTPASESEDDFEDV